MSRIQNKKHNFLFLFSNVSTFDGSQRYNFLAKGGLQCLFFDNYIDGINIFFTQMIKKLCKYFAFSKENYNFAAG